MTLWVAPKFQSLDLKATHLHLNSSEHASTKHYFPPPCPRLRGSLTTPASGPASPRRMCLTPCEPEASYPFPCRVWVGGGGGGAAGSGAEPEARATLGKGHDFLRPGRGRQRISG